MAVLQDLDAAALRGWVVRGREALQAVCEDLNVLNVYPVPDADTGTNLFLTLTAADDAVAALEPAATLQETAGTVARALLLGARGNSGGMLAQFVRGLLDVLVEPGEPHPGRRLARGLTRGAELAGACLAAPVAGTMLTVAQDAARAAQAVNGTLADTVTAAR
ncbi:MAG: dihydroxyacetone kinase, partial [Frankiales bacterium]|nr:dihydroxyacetone kinase [Frankiales bacterium]